MKFHQILSEVSTPTGSIFIRFREKVGEVSANPQRGERSEATYLTAYAGFANAPEDLKQADALRNFNTITSAQDIVSMIKAIFTDKVFLSAKSVTIYDDFTKPMQGDKSPIYKRHPFLLKFMKWVEREGGNQIKIADKVGQEGPPKLKRPRKENPNFGRKLRDVEQGETKKTVTFTVGPRFYKQAQRDLPNLMKYRGPNGTFVMPNELFMQFRAQAEKTYPYAEIKLVNRVATGESLNEGSDKGPHDCGAVDGYYGRSPNPHKIEMGKRVKLTDPREIAAYMAGYKDDSAGSKVYESYTINGKKVTKSAYEKEMSKAGKGSKKNKKTTEGIMKYALPIAGAALGGIYGTDLGTAGLDSYVDATTDPIELATNVETGEKFTMPASQGAKMANDGAKALGIKPTGAIGQYANASDAIQKYGSPVGAALGAGAGMALSPSDRRKNSVTDEEEGDTPAAAPTPPPAPAPLPVSGITQPNTPGIRPDSKSNPASDLKPDTTIPDTPNYTSRAAREPAPTVGKAPPSSDPMVKNLAPISADGSASPARLTKLAAMAGSQSGKPAATTIADKKMGATFETRLVDMEDDEYWLMEAGKASRAFCKANARKRSNMGASQLSSCISQGYIPHKSGKSVKIADRRIKLDGVKMKGEKYGGPKSTKAGEST